MLFNSLSGSYLVSENIAIQSIISADIDMENRIGSISLQSDMLPLLRDTKYTIFISYAGYMHIFYNAYITKQEDNVIYIKFTQIRKVAA